MHDLARSLSALGMKYAFGKAIQSQIASLISDPYGFYAELIALLPAVLLLRLLVPGSPAISVRREGFHQAGPPRGHTSPRWPCWCSPSPAHNGGPTETPVGNGWRL